MAMPTTRHMFGAHLLAGLLNPQRKILIQGEAVLWLLSPSIRHVGGVAAVRPF